MLYGTKGLVHPQECHCRLHQKAAYPQSDSDALRFSSYAKPLSKVKGAGRLTHGNAGLQARCIRSRTDLQELFLFLKTTWSPHLTGRGPTDVFVGYTSGRSDGAAAARALFQRARRTIDPAHVVCIARPCPLSPSADTAPVQQRERLSAEISLLRMMFPLRFLPAMLASITIVLAGDKMALQHKKTAGKFVPGA